MDENTQLIHTHTYFLTQTIIYIKLQMPVEHEIEHKVHKKIQWDVLMETNNNKVWKCISAIWISSFSVSLTFSSPSTIYNQTILVTQIQNAL